MSNVNRILLSEGCCSFGLIGESAELWVALLLGVTFSGIVVLSFNIWTGHSRRAASDAPMTSDPNRCTSPDCIRCQPDHPVINRAIEDNLKRYLKVGRDRFSDPGSARVRAAVTDHLSKEAFGLLERPTSDLGQSPTLFHFPKLSCRPWWNVDCAPSQLRNDLRLLEKNARKICSDFRSLDELYRQDAETSGWQVNVNGWRVYHLLDQGTHRDHNCVRCPDTLRVLNKLNRLMVNCVFGFASFSVLEPGVTIDTHCGSTNVRLRCHLGIDIPFGCEIAVSGVSRSWTEHRCLLFDDSYPHSVSHRGSTPRAIFLADFWHPELNRAECAALENIFPPKCARASARIDNN